MQHHRAAFADLKNQAIAEVRLLPQGCVQRVAPGRIPQRTCGHIDRQFRGRVLGQEPKGQIEGDIVDLPAKIHRLNQRHEMGRRDGPPRAVLNTDQPLIKRNAGGVMGQHHRLKRQLRSAGRNRIPDDRHNIIVMAFDCMSERIAFYLRGHRVWIQHINHAEDLSGTG